MRHPKVPMGETKRFLLHRRNKQRGMNRSGKRFQTRAKRWNAKYWRQHFQSRLTIERWFSSHLVPKAARGNACFAANHAVLRTRGGSGEGSFRQMNGAQHRGSE